MLCFLYRLHILLFYILYLFYSLGSVSSFATSTSHKVFSSIRAKEANVRVGPGHQYKVISVFHTMWTPVVIKGISGDWSLVQDINGLSGWVQSKLISNNRRYVIAIVDSPVCRVPVAKMKGCHRIAVAEKGALFRAIKCKNNWCRVKKDAKFTGWIHMRFIWGVNAGEFFG